MTSVKRAFAQTPYGQVHYRFSGDSSSPPVILFHESPVSGQIYEHALPLLGKHFFAVAPDTPGYGDSEPPETPLEIPGYAARLLSFIRELGLKSPSLVGCHTGASIAIEVATQAPSLVHKLVLMGVALYTAEERKEMLATWMPPFEPKSDGSHLQWLWERYQRIYGADTPPGLLHSAVAQFLKAGERYDWAYQAAFRYDPTPALRNLKQPVLFLVAENDLLAYKNEEAIAITPNSRGRVVPGLNGQLHARVPEYFAESVYKFFTE
jgi:pimeloyl-ACP methyl ester carboxylesterase